MSNRSVRQTGALVRRNQDIKLYEGILKSGVFPIEIHGRFLEKQDITRKLKLALSEVKTLESKGVA